MMTLEVWWSPVASCYRIEDGEMFSYYNLDLVIAHFRNRDRPARAQLVAKPHDMHTAMLDLALRKAGIAIEYATA